MRSGAPACIRAETPRLRCPYAGSEYPLEYKLTLNTASPLVKKLDGMAESDRDKAKRVASYVYKLALLSQKKFNAEEMQEFMRDGVALMLEL